MLVLALQLVAPTPQVLAVYNHLRRMQRGMESWGESFHGVCLVDKQGSVSQVPLKFEVELTEMHNLKR